MFKIIIFLIKIIILKCNEKEKKNSITIKKKAASAALKSIYESDLELLSELLSSSEAVLLCE